MAKRRRNRVTAEDRALWERAMRDASPLQERRAPETADPEKPAPEAAPRPTPKPSAPVDPTPRIVRPEGRPAPASTATRLASPIDTLDPARGLDRRTAERLKRGRRPPEARLDLHGMTAERAHSALARFIRQSRAQGRRCVLVVTGKGGRKPAEDAPFMPERTGVLRHSVPLWLNTPPLSAMIVGVYSAHRTHGGEGALYVYLRKSR
ncbi:MAG: Smr/MutS family protein [Pseudomonadota bacterium]